MLGRVAALAQFDAMRHHLLANMRRSLLLIYLGNTGGRKGHAYSLWLNMLLLCRESRPAAGP